MTRTHLLDVGRAPQFALTVSCPSARGQVAALVQFLDERGCYIDEFDVFDDDTTARFLSAASFMGRRHNNWTSRCCATNSPVSPRGST